MKRILSLMLVMMLIVTGCAGGTTESENSGDGKKVGLLMSNLNDVFTTYLVESATAEAEKHGYSVSIQDAQEDIIKQQDQVTAAIEQDYDAVVIIPVDTSAMGPITDKLRDANIPLVYVNRNPYADSDIPEGVYYVGAEEIVAGKIQGEHLVELMGEEGGVGILMGMLGNEGAVKRTEGNEEIFSNYPGIEILAKETANWQKDQAITITENWLITYEDKLNAILANNDQMALGAVTALESIGRDDVIVIGIDATPDGIELVESGKMAATVLQDPAEQGKVAVDVVKNIIDGNDQESITWVELDLVTPENVADYK